MSTNTPSNSTPPFRITAVGRAAKSWRRIPLHGRAGVIGEAKVDAQDYERVSAHRWHKTAGGYAATNTGPRANHKKFTMHRFIMGFPTGKAIDHKNHDQLDNRRKNLRICEPWHNQQNNSGSGVSFSKSKGRWRARICWNGTEICIGTYVTEEDAKRARKCFEKATRLPLFVALEAATAKHMESVHEA